jgi:hypothetical protein
VLTISLHSTGASWRRADGQVRSAAARFGLIAVAAELATSFGIFPWQPGAARAAAAA